MGIPRSEVESALQLIQGGENAQAEAKLRQWLADHAEDVDAHGLLGLACRNLNKFEDSARSFHRAAQLRPGHETLANFAASLSALGRFEDALQHYRQALAFQANNAETHRNLGVCLAKAKRTGEAETAFRSALRLRPDFPEALNNLWALLVRQNRIDEAREVSARLVKLRDVDAEAWTAHGASLHRSGQLPAAIEAYANAVRLNPALAKARHNRGVALMALGRFADGWPDFTARWDAIKAQRPKFDFPAWDGSDLSGKRILLWTEQGLGDTLNFIRYGQELTARGATVVFQCPKPLLKVLERTLGIATFISEGDATGVFDFHASVVDLPKLLGVGAPADIVRIEPYVHPDPALVARWGERLSCVRGLRVGVCWRGNALHPEDRRRSFAPSLLAGLAAIPGVKLISVQKDPKPEELAALGKDLLHFADLDTQSGPFMDTAAIMRHLDLVISCDTSVGHLAGAMGTPIWLALPMPADWRWLENRSDTPWYPSLRLYRQTRPGDWSSVFAAMIAELRKLTARKTVQIETSPGEFFDRLGIFEIKKERFAQATQRARVENELQDLASTRAFFEPLTSELANMIGALKEVNTELWDLEDDIRELERAGNFGERFIHTANSIHQLNDRRAALKRAINHLLGSPRNDEKSYRTA